MKNIHILPTSKPSRLLLSGFGALFLTPPMEFKNSDTYQHIYITFDSEIKMDDWYLDDTNSVRQAITECESYWTHRKKYQKIILTTDQDLIEDGVQAIDDEFLEWFVKNPSCEEVEVEEFEPIYGHQNNSSSILYKIIIPKTKDRIFSETSEETKQKARDYGNVLAKQETLEEAAVINYKKLYEGEPLTQDVPIDAFKQGAKWMQEQFKNHLQKLDKLCGNK